MPLVVIQPPVPSPPPIQVNIPAPTVPWQQTVAAIGTLLAVGVAIAVAIIEGKRARTARAEAEQLKADQASEKRRAAAVRVSGWVEEAYVPDVGGSVYIRKASAHLFNNGVEPVSSVSASIGVGWPTRSIGPLSIPVALSLPPGRELSWDLTLPLHAHDDTQSPLVEILFTDPQGVRWHRRFDGTLEEVAERETKLFDSNDEQAALAQAGRLDDPWNPLAVAMAFVNAMTAEPWSRETVELLLAPEAPGWKETSDDELSGIAEELRRYGLAVFSHYRAPHVAYVKFASPDHQSMQVASGPILIQDARFITLTFVRERGWRVFSYGGALTDPDRIIFPSGALLDDHNAAPVPYPLVGVPEGSSKRGGWFRRNRN